MITPKNRWVVLSVLLLALMVIAEGTVFAQTEGGNRYFPETGHWVSGEFLDKYQRVSNPIDIYGLPITDAFEDDLTGMVIQYFEKARFELHPEAIPDLRVQLTELGFFLYQPGQTLPEQPNSPACRVFTETGQEFKVCYAFLEFYQANGGISQFGYPLSNFEVHEGWIVQYFQRARFEWHPELPAGQRVVLTNLGSRYFYLQGENPARLRPNREDNIPQLPVTDLKLRAFAATSLMPLTGSQTLYVIVQDQNLNPVAGARVDFSVIYANGDVQRLQMPVTGENGVAVIRFPVSVQSPQMVRLIVNAEYRDIQVRTRTSFQTWW